MVKKRIILLGAFGFVGSEFADQIQQRGYSLLKLGRGNCELYSVAALRRCFESYQPTMIINCAGYTGKPNVDACELDKANCLAGNAVLPGIIAEACLSLGIPWGHVSSGCIYTGRRADGSGFDELDPPNFSFRQNNCSFYSGTKALDEEVLSDSPQCYLWRLRIPFSHVDAPRNYLTKLMRYQNLLEAENSLSHLGEFVTAALDCFDKQLPFGIYNLTNPGSVFTSEVVEMIRESGVCDKQFNFFRNEDEFMRLAAKTPRSNCVLDSGKALAAGLSLTPIATAIRQSLQRWSQSPQMVTTSQ